MYIYIHIIYIYIYIHTYIHTYIIVIIIVIIIIIIIIIIGQRVPFGDRGREATSWHLGVQAPAPRDMVGGLFDSAPMVCRITLYSAANSQLCMVALLPLPLLLRHGQMREQTRGGARMVACAYGRKRATLAWSAVWVHLGPA